jgi:hypothetical protein
LIQHPELLLELGSDPVSYSSRIAYTLWVLNAPLLRGQLVKALVDQTEAQVREHEAEDASGVQPTSANWHLYGVGVYVLSRLTPKTE